MNALEKRLEYHELLMTYDNLDNIKEYKLPEGYHFEFYKNGDIDDWINIHLSTGEFCNLKKSYQYFHDFYDYFIDELPKRCIFIVDDKTGEKVGTATISKLEKDEYGYSEVVDWVAIKKEYQGKGLSKPLLSRFLLLARELGNNKILLHTQTHTWLAAKLYLDLGFEPFNINDDIKGWEMLYTLTNHPKLKGLSRIDESKMYDNDFVLIQKKLENIFGNDFTYSVWNKNGRNDVYVRNYGKDFIFKFYIKNSKAYLKQVIVEEDLNKVIEEYNKVKSPEELLTFMNRHLRYGFVGCNSGYVYGFDDEDFGDVQYKENDWHLSSCSELLRECFGHCWNQTELERDWFDSHGYKTHTLFVWFYNEDETKSYPCHTYLVYEDNNKFYFFEHSDGANKGIYEFDSLDDAINYQRELHIKYTKSLMDLSIEEEQLIKVHEYDAKLGCNAIDFLENAINSKNLLKCGKVRK